MASDVLATLDLDKKDSLRGKFIVVEERSGCEADFFFSCFLSKLAKERHGIVLVTVHHHYEHYRAVGLKMGHNLDALREGGSLVLVDHLSECEESAAGLYDRIAAAVDLLLSREHESCCVLVDDLTHLLDASERGISETVRLVDRCRELLLLGDDERCALIVGTHVTTSESDDGRVLSRLLAHSADLTCEVSPLKTGRSSAASGSYRIVTINTEKSSKFTQLHDYLYKTFDRGIKVFAPGLER